MSVRPITGFGPVIQQTLKSRILPQIPRSAFSIDGRSKNAALKTAEYTLDIVSNTAAWLKAPEHQQKRENLKQLLGEIGHTALQMQVPDKIIEGVRTTIADGIPYIIVPTIHNDNQCAHLSWWLKARAGKKHFSIHIEGMVRNELHERHGVQLLQNLSALNGYRLAEDGYFFGMEDRGFPELLFFGNAYQRLRVSMQNSLWEEVLIKEEKNFILSLELEDTLKIWEEFEALPDQPLKSIYDSCTFEINATPVSRFRTLMQAFKKEPKLYIELFRILTLLSLEKLPITAVQKATVIRDFINNPKLEEAYPAFTSKFHAPMRDPIMVKNVKSAPLPSDVVRVIEVGNWHRDNILELLDRS